MEKWSEIENGFIPIDDYPIDCYINECQEMTLLLIGKRKFRLSITGVLGFRIIDASSEIRDAYAEAGLAEGRPEFYKSCIYEIKNAEFSNKLMPLNDNNLYFHHYKVISLNYLIDIVAEGIVHIAEYQ